MPPTTLLSTLSRLSLSAPRSTTTLSPLLQQTRHASHASQGVANKAAQGPGKRLGAKKGNTELVVPGNIIFRQRGTHWFAGENCVMGRDHTISTLVKGWVRYYRDPAWPSKKFIGVVLNQDEMLPRRHGVPRRRRLGMELRPMENPPDAIDIGAKAPPAELVKQAVAIGAGKRKLRFEAEPDTKVRQGYQVRESNWSIGRTAERERITARTFKKREYGAWRDRFTKKKGDDDAVVIRRAVTGGKKGEQARAQQLARQ